MLSSKAKGAQTELNCLAYLHGLGYDVSVPWGDNARYDLVLDVNHKLYKLQCKTSSLVDESQEGVYKFSCQSVYMNTQGTRTVSYNEQDVDFFCTFIEGKCYLVPLAETSKREKVMRFVPPRNGQKVGITFAQEYLAEKQIEKLLKDN